MTHEKILVPFIKSKDRSGLPDLRECFSVLPPNKSEYILSTFEVFLKFKFQVP